MPQHDLVAVLNDPVADVAVRAERVDVERQQPAVREVPTPQRGHHRRRCRQWFSASSRHVTRSNSPTTPARTCRPRTRRHAQRACAGRRPPCPGVVAALRVIPQIEQRLQACRSRRPRRALAARASPCSRARAVRPPATARRRSRWSEVVRRREHVVAARGGQAGPSRRLTKSSAQVVSTLGRLAPYDSTHLHRLGWGKVSAQCFDEAQRLLGASAAADDRRPGAAIRAWRIALTVATPRPEPWIARIARREALRVLAARPRSASPRTSP